MSEMTNFPTEGLKLQARLLATASAAALLMTMYASQQAAASETDEPVIWIELGGEFTQLETSQASYLPPFVLAEPRLPFITESPADIEKGAVTSWDGNAKITFEPEGSDWSLSAGILYGRSVRSGSRRQQTAQRSVSTSIGYDAYQSTNAKNNESHMILDFQAGKDVGLGVIGNSGRSKVSVGVRYAQLNSESTTNIFYQPTNSIHTYYKFSGTLNADRKFTGIGPSLSWDASAGLIGQANNGISFDWGVNGAVLFGRQRVRGHHQTTNLAVTYSRGQHKNPVYQTSVPLNRSKQVVVPNLGGFAGVSWRYPNAKISMGYRADFFLGAMDGGIDTARKENVGFYGPFASVSIGLGG
jgi:hypothetical protein